MPLHVCRNASISTHTPYYAHTITNSHSLVTGTPCSSQSTLSWPLALLSMLFALHPLDVPAIFTLYHPIDISRSITTPFL